MKRLALAAGIIMALVMAVPVFAHDVQSVGGVVDCQGNYSITVTGDVYDGVHLIVKLGGVTIYDAAQNGTSAVQTFGPFTGSGATVGEAIFAKSGDESDASGASSTLALNGDEACPTPTPTPSPTPVITPSPTPVVTLSPTPVVTPHVTATPSLPATNTDGSSNDPFNSAWVILVGAIMAAAVVVYGISRRLRE